MNKYRTLIWEQTRVAGVLAVWCFLVGTIVLCSIRFSFHQQEEHVAFLFVVLGTAACFILRQDGQGHLVTSFEKRLTRLPVGSTLLVSVVFFSRVFFLGLFTAAVTFLYRGLYPGDDAFNAQLPLLGLVVFLLAQTVVWTRRSITLWPWIALGALVALPLLAALGNGTNYFVVLANGMKDVATPSGCLALFMAAYGVGLVGVSWERREERHGLPTLGELAERFAARETEGTTFPTPLAAQVWYEQARTARLLPALTLLLTLGGALIALGIPQTRLVTSIAAQVIPLVAFGAAALVTGIIAFRPRSGYMYLRPVETRLLADARMRALGRSLLATLPLATALSVAGFLVFGGAERALLAESIRHGEAGISEVLTIFLGPVLIAAFAGWVLLWPLGRATGGIALCAISCPLAILVIANVTDFFNFLWIGTADEFGRAVFWGEVILIPAVILGVLGSAWRRGHLGLPRLLTLLAVAMTVAFFLVQVGPNGFPLYLTLPIATVPALWLISPAAGVPATIQSKRVG